MKLLPLLAAACVAFIPSVFAEDAKAEEAIPLPFKLLSTATFKEDGPPIIPPDLKKLDGKRVRVTGFINPYDDPEKMTKMLLTEAAVGCFFCNPPQENGVVFVRMPANAKPIAMDSDTLTVEGTLHFLNHNKKDEEAQQFLFTIDDAKVVSKK